MPDLGLNSLEFEQNIKLRDAYLVMFEFLSRNWEGCWSTELGSVMGELGLLTKEEGSKWSADAAVLPTFLEAYRSVVAAQASEQGYIGADLEPRPEDPPQ